MGINVIVSTCNLCMCLCVRLCVCGFPLDLNWNIVNMISLIMENRNDLFADWEKNEEYLATSNTN